jgi:transmembrane sensor
VSRTPEQQALSLAAHWFARLGAAPGDTALQRQWQAWHDEHPLHQWAWQRVGLLQTQLGNAKGALGYQVLDRAGRSMASSGRRALLKSLLLGVGVGALGWAGYRQAPVLLADLRTGTGERLTFKLDDGSTLVLNTDSAVDIAYTAQTRLLVLQKGEMYVATAKDARPFIVRSAQGAMQALGTRFRVRQQDGFTQLAVFEHAVAVRPQAATGEQPVINSGQGVSFNGQALFDQHALDPSADAWINGRLVIDGWRLDRLVGELQRYRSGYLGCAPEVAHLRVSGTYPLDDIDLALSAIARSLPVDIERHTGFWTRLIAKKTAA